MLVVPAVEVVPDLFLNPIEIILLIGDVHIVEFLENLRDDDVFREIHHVGLAVYDPPRNLADYVGEFLWNWLKRSSRQVVLEMGTRGPLI